jgi:O-antigen/teichoic acid export membrane protein
MKVMKGADVIVLGVAGSTGLVTGYTLTRYVPEAVGHGLMILIFAIMPGLGGLIGAGEIVRARSLRTEMLASTWLTGTVAGSMVLLWEASFLRMWVGEGYYPGSVALSLIVLMILQWTIIRVDSNIIDLTLNLRWKVVLGVLSAGLSVGLSVLLLTRGQGIEGLVIGFIAGRVILTVTYPWIVGRILGISPGRQLMAALRPALVTAAMLGLAAVAGETFRVHSWVGLFFAAAGSAIVAGFLALFAGLGAGERRRLWNRARRVARFT